MSITADITGFTLNRLTAVSFVEKDKNGAAIWLWKCACGNEKKLATYRVRTENDKSCGCLQIETGRINGKSSAGKKGNSARNEIVYGYRRMAKYKKRVWLLTSSHAERVLTSPCHYCGSAPSKVKKTPGGVFVHGGIDRVDSSVGYTPENVVSCCETCNTMKMDHSTESFMRHIKTILAHNGGLA